MRSFKTFVSDGHTFVTAAFDIIDVERAPDVLTTSSKASVVINYQTGSVE